MMRHRRAKSGGFTLIELLVVVAIIGILAGVVVGQYGRSIVKAKEAVLRENLFVTRNAINQYFADKGKYPFDLHALVETRRMDSAQIFYNLLVPSAGESALPDYPAEDYRQLLSAARSHGVGSIGVRVLAGGALAGHTNRHPLGMPEVAPIGSPTTYGEDAERARRFAPLIEAGFAGDLPELAVRYVISNPELCTTEIGIATLAEVQRAAAAINAGPLPKEALEMVADIQAGFAV